MDAGFELLEHGGDLRLRGWGGTVGEAARQLLLALWSSLYGEGGRPQPSRWEVWEVPEDLPLQIVLVELLSEALFRATVDGVALASVDGDLRRARLGLAPIPQELVPVREVKAVTYNDPRLERLAGGDWIAEVTVDL